MKLLSDLAIALVILALAVALLMCWCVGRVVGKCRQGLPGYRA